MENKTEEDQKNRQRLDRQKLAKVMGGTMKPVTVELYDPYVKFAKEFIQFFNVQDSFEIFLMRLIYDGIERLQRDLTEFVESRDGQHFTNGPDWYNKNPHIACTASQPNEEQ
jgi:hypothetical protein